MNSRALLSAVIFTGLGIGCGGAAASAPAPIQPSPSPSTPAVVVDPQGWRAQTPTAGISHPIAYPATEVAALGNGLALRVAPRNAPTLAIGVTCKSGAIYDPPQQSGVAALTARMLTEGTTKLDGEALAIATEELGSHLSSDSSEEFLSVQLEVLPSSLAQALELLSEVIIRPAFRAEDFSRVRHEWLDRLRTQREESGSVAQLLARRALLGPDAGANPSGNPLEVAKLRVSDLRTFQRQTLTPSRCALLAAGPIHVGELSQAAARNFATWRASGAEPKRRQPKWSERSRVLFLARPEAVQTSVYLATQAPGRIEAGFEARRVVDKLFGGLFTSRLNLNLREEHAFTYGAFSRLNARADYGVWALQTEVKAETTWPALEQVSNEVRRLQDTGVLDAAEIARGKTDLIHENAARLEQTALLLANLQVEFGSALAPSYFHDLEGRVSSVDKVQVAKQLPAFTGNPKVLCLVGPTEVLKANAEWEGIPIETVEASFLDH